ncbi:ABC transporter permease [Ekhidna sp.]|uniref:ABC transporter permease n=1 Tax=Ekhidna sp. TaxID=2608089 RepID=UPI003296AF14
MNSNPPKLFLRLLRWFCHPRLIKPIEGDLMELYEERVQELGKRKADIKFMKDVLLLFRKDLIKPSDGTNKINTYGMFKNHLKISFRNLLKQKGYTAINVFGLTVSMAITMLIILFIIDQDSQDEHNPNATNTYRAITVVHDVAEDKDRSFGTSPYEFNQLIPLHVESVKESTQIAKASGLLVIDDDEFQFSGLYVSPNFLSFFHFDLLQGNNINALNNENNLILSKEMAVKIFGESSPLGKVITLEKLGDFIISGVIDRSKYKTHLTYDAIIPISAFSNKTENKSLLADWEEGSKVFYNYFRLKEGASVQILDAYFSNLDFKMSDDKKDLFRFETQRLDQINLGSLIRNEIGTTTPNFVAYFFGVLGLVLILSASFNYMNMAIARGLKRAKEVGVRKVLGAGRRQVIAQFLVEAQLVIFISLICAFLLLQMLVPIFNDLKILRDIDGAITMNFNSNFYVYFSFIAFSIIVGIVSGVYPALYLSSFKSLSVLKGSNGSGRSPSFLLRKVLVFFQYAFSVIFIITTIILYQQAKVFDTTDYGFEHANIINVPMRKNIPYETFRNELMKKSAIAGVSAVSNLPVLSFFEDIELTSRSSTQENIKSSIFSIDAHAIDNLGIEILAGNNFSASSQNEKENVIINEKGMDALGFASPMDALNATIELHTSDKDTREEITVKKKIIGVVKDFNYQFVFVESGPLIMQYDPESLTTINIKVAGISPKKGAEIIESVWNEFDNNHAMHYETYAYGMEDINSEFSELVNIVGIVGFIAILIACLGQFSMVVHHVELKTKEIGIRKVLGSGINSLMIGLSKGFIWVIVIAVVLSTPLAVLINIAWTSKVYNAPEVSFINISVGVGIILTMALGTIYIFISRAVKANPVESLKCE